MAFSRAFLPLFKSSYLFIRSFPAKFKVSRAVLGDFALFLSLPSLRHMTQVPIAPLEADIQAILQEPVVQPDAQPEVPAVQPAALQVNDPQPPPGGQIAAVQPAVELPAQGAAQPVGQPELVGLIYFCSIFAGFSLACALSFFYLFAFAFCFWSIPIHPSLVICASHVAWVL